MKIDPQSSAELTQLSRLIEGMSVAMMTTLDDDDALVSHPMSPLEMDSLSAIWFFADLGSKKSSICALSTSRSLTRTNQYMYRFQVAAKFTQNKVALMNCGRRLRGHGFPKAKTPATSRC